ncbi:calpain 10 [Homo sapiens]|uniref:CAPN10 isoform 5 n=1 Tax=Pongo abelii TaxID=9601 RepID=A0A2J8RPB2_PONAB|nr:calpain-like protease CAPN10h [Homo sapiens]EAW71199.1 hCG32657, isoform CRA_d [Homo sapiens]KAI2527739.1 calpain 10 [Homo sapiens]KAI4038898.1 calpain 10 [Homo sapiens]PNJ10369.1 CAPN10 isoform 5 [Pongo abelii]
MRAGRGATPARELFRDAAFPAADSSLFCDLSTPLAQFREDITWRRPQVPEGGRSQDAPPLLLQEPLLSCVPHRYAQEVSRLCLLPAGTYKVVPSTYLPDTEGAFTVTIATRIDRPSIHSQEMLGQFLQEVSVMAVMKT